ncbi:MAG: hypothetical protein ABSE91_03230 [Patescibacteria group bacterium]|jgi:hypothetical protein
MSRKALAPSVTTRDPKGLKFISVVEAAYNNAALSEDEAQRVNETPGLADLIGNFIAEHRVRNEFSDEEVPSKYGYLSGYSKPAGLTEQCNQLRAVFPGVGYANHDLLQQIEKGEVELPVGAEGWFAIPNWMKNPGTFGSTYSQAVQTVLNAIKKARDGRFYNYREGQIDEKHLRQSARSKKFWKELAEVQGNPDILVVPAQFGIRHRGRSVRRARVVIECTTGEFGLGAFVVGVMILTNPVRLQRYDDLWIDCAGDEFSSGAGGQFDGAPCFRFRDDEVWFGSRWIDDASGCYGSASGFLPKSLLVKERRLRK